MALAARRWVEATCRAQGIASKVSDRSALTKVATAFRTLDAPERGHPARIKLVQAPDTRVDSHSVKQGDQDRPAAIKAQVAPLGPESIGLAG